MPKQRFGLGRGLDALIPGAEIVPDDVPMDTALSNSALFEVPCDAIAPNPQQPRMPMTDDDQLIELATSIQQYGLLQPLLVTLDPDSSEEHPRYRLIAGERRWRAAQLAGIEHVPVVIRDATPQIMLEMALVENLQRTDLNPLEEAQGYLMLMEEYNLTQDQVAERIGRRRPTIANSVRLLQLPQEVREMLIQLPKVFTEGHARAVLQINGEAERITAAHQIVAQMMSVRAAEELARRYNEAALRLTPDRRGAKVRQQSYETRQLEEEFTRAVEMKVRLQRSTKGKGYLTLYFSNEDQLQRLYEVLVQERTAANSHIEPLRNYGMDSSDGVNGVNGLGDMSAVLDDTFDISFDTPPEDGSEN